VISNEGDETRVEDDEDETRVEDDEDVTRVEDAADVSLRWLRVRRCRNSDTPARSETQTE
jgi:hypothetical protein